jgi:hypothetical protein
VRRGQEITALILRIIVARAPKALLLWAARALVPVCGIHLLHGGLQCALLLTLSAHCLLQCFDLILHRLEWLQLRIQASHDGLQRCLNGDPQPDRGL